MKTKNIIFAISLFLLIIIFTNINAQSVDDLTKLKYFKIYVTTSDDSLFLKVQKEMAIDPYLEAYMLIVNISSVNSDDYYVVFGEENDFYSIKMKWDNFSNDVRNGLIAWSKSNKVKVELVK